MNIVDRISISFLIGFSLFTILSAINETKITKAGILFWLALILLYSIFWHLFAELGDTV